MSLQLVAAVAVVALCQPQLGEELVVNGGFDQPSPEGNRPAGWSVGGNVEWIGREGNMWVRLRDNGTVSQVIKLRPEWWKLRVSVKVRCRDVRRGQEGWHDARVGMMFADDEGKRVGPWPPVMCWTGTFDWRRESKDFVIPRGAKALHISCAIFDASGVVEYDDLSVQAIANFPRREDAPAPVPVEELWSIDRAWKQETPTRGRVCINGLWQFIPVQEAGEGPPPAGSGWGWMKVPGNWYPGSGVEPVAPAIWEAEARLNLRYCLRAWYRRRVHVPATWRGRRVYLYADNVVRWAVVYVNGRKMGRISWPDGRVDITAAVQAGADAEVAIFVDALPVAPSEWAAKSEQEKRDQAAKSRLRGLCGDVYLDSEPQGARISEALIMPSVRKHCLRVRLSLAGAAPGEYRLDAQAREGRRVVRTWRDVKIAVAEARSAVVADLPWPNPKLWDIDRPNMYELLLSLKDGDGRLLDQYLPQRFGFREFWIQGRRVFLNGRPLHIRAVDLQSVGRDGGLSSATASVWTLRRFRDLGMNFVYLSQYHLDWGQVRYLDGIMEAADKVGFLMSVCMPHPRDIAGAYERGEDSKRQYWERMARWVARRAGNHPSVIMYAMSHNWLGHPGDQNPRFLDASFPEFDPSLGEWRLKARKAAEWAERFVGRLDPSRPVYHHQCGNFGQWITLNCYLNWVPIQERMEWLSQYYHADGKPIFLVEFGMPHHASFQRHRGAPFIWRNAVDAEPLNVEYAAMLFGDAAYELAPANIAGYQTMAEVYERRGRKLFFWEVFGEYWDKRVEKDFLDVKAEYTRYTWPAFRTWELAAVGPWDWNDFARPRPRRVELRPDLGKLQRPGFQPDFVHVSEWYHEPPGKPSDYTVLGRALRRLNQDLLAYIAGKPEKFTSRDHIFAPGERVRKQLIFINDTPQQRSFAYTWTAKVGTRRVGGDRGQVTVPAGGVKKVAVGFAVPRIAADARGRISLIARVGGKTAAGLQDEFAFEVIAPCRPSPATRIGIIDPVGTTKETLRRLGIEVIDLTRATTAPPGLRGLVVGRLALRGDEQELWQQSPEYAAEQALPPREALKSPGLHALPSWVRDFVSSGGRVLVCEQIERVLSRTFGFRTAFAGTRRVFVRAPWHPVMKGLSDRLLSLWRGESTISVARTRSGPVGDPRVDWLGFVNSRVWKWGTYGQVATAVIEKPHCGDFLALADCEFDLAYTPLLEYRHPGGGCVLFCQFDISERTEREPAAERLWANLIDWLASAPEASERVWARRPTVYVGGPEGEKLLRELRVRFATMKSADQLTPRHIIVAGRGANAVLGGMRDAVADALRAGGIVFCLAAEPQELNSWAPVDIKLARRPVLYALVGPSEKWLLQGLGPSEMHWRGKVAVWAVARAPVGSIATSTGVVAGVPVGRGWLVLCQAVPDMFDEGRRPYLRLSRQRCAQMVSRLLANCGAPFDVPALDNLVRGPALSVNLAGEWLIKADPDERGDAGRWFAAELKEDASWRKIQQPGFWERAGVGMDDYDGVAWLRVHFRLEKAPAEGPVELVIGAVDDEDWTYVNGRLVGHRGQDTNPDDYWAVQRRYEIPPGLLRAGDNVVAVKVRDLRQAGGIAKGPVMIASPPRWVASYYINTPVRTDDPYRYTRW